MSLDGARVLITGGAGGIGRATAELLARRGAHVTAADLEAPRFADERIHGVALDVTDPASVDAAMAAASAGEGVDVCIANAGVFREYDAFLETPGSVWDEIIAVNLRGVLTTLRSAARDMVASGRGGRLLATASNTGLRPEPGMPAYVACKAGIVALVQTLAVDLAEHGITVNAVAPGAVDTPMVAGFMAEYAGRRGVTTDELWTSYRERVPAGRPASPNDVAGIFAFLSSADAAHITGATICVDGGEMLRT